MEVSKINIIGLKIHQTKIELTFQHLFTPILILVHIARQPNFWILDNEKINKRYESNQTAQQNYSTEAHLERFKLHQIVLFEQLN